MTGGGGFVMVPDWLRAKKPSGNAILAYINLGAFGTWNPGTATYDECRPAWVTLAAEMGVSESTAKRAVEELVELGAATKSLRFKGEQPLPSAYRLIFGVLLEPGTEPNRGRGVGSPVTPGGGVTGDPRVGSPVTCNQEPLTKNQEPPPPDPPPQAPPPVAATPEEEDPVPPNPTPPPPPLADQVLADVLADVPRARHPDADLTAQLHTRITSALAAGWTPAALQTALDGRFPTTGNVGAVLLHRCGRLGKPPPPEPPAPAGAARPAGPCPDPECGADGNNPGWITHGQGARPCQHCRPDPYARWVARYAQPATNQGDRR